MFARVELGHAHFFEGFLEILQGEGEVFEIGAGFRGQFRRDGLFGQRADERLVVFPGGVLGGGTERTSVPASGIIDNKETKNLAFIKIPCPALQFWGIYSLIFFGGSQ